MRTIPGLLAAFLIAGCNTGRLALPTLSSDGGGCRGVGVTAVLAGDATDPRVAWLVGPAGGRQDIIWPPGFTARFAPRLEILDGAGAVVLRAGDKIEGGCVAARPTIRRSSF